MITGLQVREACDLLRWTRYDLNRRTALPLWVIDRALGKQSGADIAQTDRVVLEEAFSRAGVDFVDEPEGPQRAKLRSPPPAVRTM